MRPIAKTTGYSIPRHNGVTSSRVQGKSGEISVGADNFSDGFLCQEFAEAIARCKGRTDELVEYLKNFKPTPIPKYKPTPVS